MSEEDAEWADRDEDVNMEEPEVETLDVVCSVCEEGWAADRLEEHTELCTVLRQVWIGAVSRVDSHGAA
eukprot:208970-Chlamydomonas_euryale.AAC.1